MTEEEAKEVAARFEAAGWTLLRLDCEHGRFGVTVTNDDHAIVKRTLWAVKDADTVLGWSHPSGAHEVMAALSESVDGE